MRKSPAAIVSTCLFIGVAGLLPAQQEKRASPHEQVSATIGGKKITIEYGRPYKKGRVIFGGLVPWDKVWRTGADEATVLTTEADLMIGSLHVPAGSYSLFTIPSQSKWTLIVNKVAKQWGAYKYDEKQNLGIAEMKVSSGPEVEQFTISIDAEGNRRGVLKMAWDQTIATVPIMVH